MNCQTSSTRRASFLLASGMAGLVHAGPNKPAPTTGNGWSGATASSPFCQPDPTHGSQPNEVAVNVNGPARVARFADGVEAVRQLAATSWTVSQGVLVTTTQVSSYPSIDLGVEQADNAVLAASNICRRNGIPDGGQRLNPPITSNADMRNELTRLPGHWLGVETHMDRFRIGRGDTPAPRYADKCTQDLAGQRKTICLMVARSLAAHAVRLGHGMPFSGRCGWYFSGYTTC